VLGELRRLASISLAPAPGSEEVVLACQVVLEAMGARDAFVLRSGDPHFLRIGSEADPTTYAVKQRGLWLMWQALSRNPDRVAACATVEDRLVMDIVPAEVGAQGNFLAMILPIFESNSEMLIVERTSRDPLTSDEVAFIETARPILCQLIDKVLDEERRQRQQRSLAALADVARAFNSANNMESALTDLATAIANASGYDWVSIFIYDEKLEHVVERGLNVARHSNTETAAMVRGADRENGPGRDLYGPLPRRMLKGIPVLIPDVFAPDAPVSPSVQAYYQRAHINSLAWVPLMFQGRPLGTIDFSSSIKREFDDSEVAVLKAFADQAATAVRGMILYRDLERSRDEVMRYAAQLEQVSEAEHYLARTDEVTGMPNRRHLEEVLRAESLKSARGNLPISVVMADVDNFKEINDRYGHPIGDQALRFVASVARECSRSSDVVGRWGGDEFLFIMPQTRAHVALDLADYFRSELRQRDFRPDASVSSLIQIPLSAGVAEIFPQSAEDSHVLVSRADQALYKAKESGRDQVRLWRPRVKAA
jgi:diguanylate cyclase (GGDEF)-like protein